MNSESEATSTESAGFCCRGVLELKGEEYMFLSELIDVEPFHLDQGLETSGLFLLL